MPIRKRYEFDGVEGARVGRFNLGINTTFIVYRIGETLIDTGPSNQWDSVKQFVSEQKVAELLLTHHHEDHCGNARDIARKFNLTPYAPALAQETMAKGYRIPPIQKAVWGEMKPVKTQVLPDTLQLANGMNLEPIATPGHAADLTCFCIPEKGWFFSGDLYISKSLRYMNAEENLGELIESIRKVLKLDFDTIFCPHNGIVMEGKKAFAIKLENLTNLCEEAQYLRSKGLRIKEIRKELIGKEGILSWLSGYNISKRNLIREALKVEL